MGRIEDDDIRRVREATDLVQLVAETVVLKQKGRLFWGCCPFHNEKTPSFKIDPGTQLWHCFGCGKGGDVFGYVMEREKLEFPEAVRQLADRAHIEIKESQGGMPRGQRSQLPGHARLWIGPLEGLAPGLCARPWQALRPPAVKGLLA